LFLASHPFPPLLPFPFLSPQAALNRLLKDNVALIAVLEALDPATGAPLPRGGGGAGAGGRALVCVANTHIHANPDLSDVKLWQVHTLLKGLEKIAASAAIPMVVAGDFNSAPGSAAHALLVARSVDGAHPDLANDPLGILRPSTKLAHGLPLASAYAAAAAIPPGGGAGGPAAARLRAGVDAEGSREPRFTNAGRDFKGTLDYVLYSADALTPTALLELPDEADLLPGAGVRGGGGLPSERWSSDHVALMAEFAYRAR
jgi:CCR4-NOT transcription complex subunit 6